MAQCFVKDCPTVVPTFSPTDFFLDLWIEAIPPRERQFTQHVDVVCSAHFEKKFILQEPVYKLGGAGTEITRIKYSLKPGAVPTIFDIIDIKDEPPDNLSDNKNKGGFRAGELVDVEGMNLTQEGDDEDILLSPKFEDGSNSVSDDDDGGAGLGTEASSPIHSHYERRRLQKKNRRRKKLHFVKRKSHKTTLPNVSTAAPTTTFNDNDDYSLKHQEALEDEGEEYSQLPSLIEKHQQDENYDGDNETSNKTPLSSEVTENESRGNSGILILVKRKPGRPRKNFGSISSARTVLFSTKKKNNLAAAKIIKNYGKKNLYKKNKTTLISLKEDLSLSSPPQQQRQQHLDKVTQSSSEATFRPIPGQISRKRKSIENQRLASGLSSISLHDDDESPSKLSKNSEGRPVSLSPLSRRSSSSPEKSQQSGMPGGPRKCFVLSCFHQCKKMFHPPKDDEALFNRWFDAIPIRERPLTEKDFICADHFTQESIKRQVLTAKGNFFPLPVLRWQLLPGAVPQLFRFPKVCVQRINLSNVDEVVRDFNEREAERSRVVNSEANQKKKRGRKKKVVVNNENEREQPALSEKVMYNCVVPGCVRPEGKRLVYHEFPLFINYRNLWAREISRKTGIDIPSTVSFLSGKRVCSQHFEHSDYVGHSTRKPLRTTAVPSIFKLVDKETEAVPIHLDLDKEDDPDLEITYAQTSCAEKRSNRAMGRSGENKRKNFVSTKVRPSDVAPVTKTSPRKSTSVPTSVVGSSSQKILSKKKITEGLGDIAADWIEKIKKAASSHTIPKILTPANISTISKSEMPIPAKMPLPRLAPKQTTPNTTTTTNNIQMPTTSVPVLSKPELPGKMPIPRFPTKVTSNSVRVPNKTTSTPTNNVQMPTNNLSNSNVPENMPTFLLLNNCMDTSKVALGGNTVMQPGSLYQTLPFIQTAPMIVTPSSTTVHEVPVAPVALVNSQSPTVDQRKRNFKATVIPKASKYVISHKHGKALVSLYNETNLPQITKTIVTPNQGKISFPCPKEDELVLIVVQNWETKKTSFSCNRAHSLLTVTNEQLSNSDIQPAAGVTSQQQQQGKSGAWNSNKKMPAGSNADHDSDVQDSYHPHDSGSTSDDDFQTSVKNCHNFFHEAKASTQGTKSSHNKSLQPTNGSAHRNAKASPVIPTLFLDSTKHGIEEMLQWKSIIKLPDENAWSVKLLTDNNKNNPKKYLFVSEVVVREGNLVLQRVLKIHQDFKFEARVHGIDFTSMFNEENDTIKSYPRLQEVLDDFSSFNICSGLSGFSYVQEVALGGTGRRQGDIWFSDKCDILSVDNTCGPCLSLLESLMRQRNTGKTSVDQPHSPSTLQLANELVTLSGSQPPSSVQRTGASLRSKMTPTTSHSVATVNSSSMSKSTKTTTPYVSSPQQIVRGASPAVNNAILSPRSKLNVGTPRATTCPAPGKTKFVVRHNASPLVQPQVNICKNSASSQIQGRQVSSPAPARTPVPPQQMSSPALPRTPIPAQTPPSAVIYNSMSSQSLVYGSTVGSSISQANYSLGNTAVSGNCVQQQQQHQQQSTQSNIYVNPSPYSVSLAYANSGQQNTTIQQKQNNNNYVKTSEVVNAQSLQTNQQIFYYPSLQPLQFQSSDIYGKPLQLTPTLPPTQTPAHSSQQSQSLHANYVNFGSGAAGMQTQPKTTQINSHSQNNIVVSGPQQNYSIYSSSGSTQTAQSPAVANAGVSSFTVPSPTVFSYYPYTQH